MVAPDITIGMLVYLDDMIGQVMSARLGWAEVRLLDGRLLWFPKDRLKPGERTL